MVIEDELKSQGTAINRKDDRCAAKGQDKKSANGYLYRSRRRLELVVWVGQGRKVVAAPTAAQNCLTGCNSDGVRWSVYTHLLIGSDEIWPFRQDRPYLRTPQNPGCEPIFVDFTYVLVCTSEGDSPGFYRHEEMNDGDSIDTLGDAPPVQSPRRVCVAHPNHEPNLGMDTHSSRVLRLRSEQSNLFRSS